MGTLKDVSQPRKDVGAGLGALGKAKKWIGCWKHSTKVSCLFALIVADEV